MTSEPSAEAPVGGAFTPNMPSITEREGLPDWPGGVADLLLKAVPGLKCQAL